jgi:hypothetical protein
VATAVKAASDAVALGRHSHSPRRRVSMTEV